MMLQQSLHKTNINLLWNSLMQAQIYLVLYATKIHNVFELAMRKMKIFFQTLSVLVCTCGAGHQRCFNLLRRQNNPAITTSTPLAQIKSDNVRR